MEETHIPLVIDFTKAYKRNIDDNNVECSGTEKIEELREPPSFLFAHMSPTTCIHILWRREKYQCKRRDPSDRLDYTITRADGRKSLLESNKLLQFLWAAKKAS